ncbi:ATP-dependent helicase/nuclease subunit B [Roseomonas alkaliterrae]|uniref:ATP-dependent helicase/nuclease subunit B n=2 Tax=Neoroseomonas alkaliterrae TaxID=1452450 RepID=A0A840XHK5_9PROT|nr:double-strand break repair protein AddB [Neoroseomonas alkaliterrae]MBB5687938.1 ATP-dependent helicase/nuclease subunit B [Neoroseomonas alkaliterrae]
MNLHAIPPHLPFLDVLAAGVLARLPAATPEALARVTILLPTRRAARGLREAFLRAAGGRAMLLPRMRALAGLSTEEADELALPDLLDLPPAVAPLTRQAVLAGMAARVPRARGGPATPEQAWMLAGELARLFDEIALEERDLAMLEHAAAEDFAEAWLARLEALVPERHAEHWQITTIVLRAVAQDWNRWLQDRGLLDIGVRRVKALAAQAAAWRAAPPGHPTIAAGIGAGGTIPAAAELLRVLAAAPQGAVVLQGLPEPVDPALWEAIGRAPTHPLAGQARLLAAMGAAPEDLRPWHEGGIAGTAPDRAVLLGRALHPAEGLSAWIERDPPRWRAAMAGLARLQAADAPQEAAAIALLLRESLETPGARAALITPDRDLARRVSAELARHGITADDSAGEPLAETPAAAFLRLLARMVAEGFAPVPLLAVLKHPLCAGGMERRDWLAAARLLERVALRGPRPAPGLAGLRASAEAAKATASAGIAALLGALESALDGFATLPGAPARPPAELLRAQMRAAEALASTPGLPGGLRLYAGEEGEPLARHLHEMEEALAHHPPIAPADWPDLFEAALAGPVAPSLRAVRGRGDAAHPRIAILGLLEARLLSFDRVVLGALEESVWPQATEPGPWMSRPMRAEFGLPEPEARIGRVAADFLYAAAAAPEAVLSSAARRGGSPSVPARWTVRLDTFLAGQEGLALPASPAAAWAAALDAPEAVRPCPRPAPAPPRALRPRRLSVSDVGLLIADPYAFHAKRVLRLNPLKPLEEEVGALDYGNLVHAAMAGFLRAIGTRWPGREAAAQAWARASEAALGAYRDRPGILAFWAPRLANIGGFVLTQEEALRAASPLRACLVEASGKAVLRLPGGEVEIEARADRLDHLPGGGWRVVDYKTGAAPRTRDLASGAAPQLPIEAWLLAQGAFPGGPGEATELLYWELKGGDVPGEVKRVETAGEDGTPFAQLAAERLAMLAETWLLGEAPFASRPHPARRAMGGDYDHLARIEEWSAGVPEGG